MLKWVNRLIKFEMEGSVQRESRMEVIYFTATIKNEAREGRNTSLDEGEKIEDVWTEL